MCYYQPLTNINYGTTTNIGGINYNVNCGTTSTDQCLARNTNTDLKSKYFCTDYSTTTNSCCRYKLNDAYKCMWLGAKYDGETSVGGVSLECSSKFLNFSILLLAFVFFLF
jgi:hypothetical protein